MEPPGSKARREREIAAQLLDKRSEQALAAIRTQPPPYILKELGERPTDPAKARSWDRGVENIEDFRRKCGVKDQRHAFGRESQGAGERAARKAADRRLAETQRRLGLERQLVAPERTRSAERGFGIGR